MEMPEILVWQFTAAAAGNESIWAPQLHQVNA